LATPSSSLRQSTTGNGGAVSPDDVQDRALTFVNEYWEDKKGAYVVYHQSCWEAFIFYAGESWIELNRDRKVLEPSTPEDEFTPQPRINRFSPAVDAVSANFGQVPEVEAIPSKDQDELSIAVADICTRLCSHLLKDLGLRDEIRDGDDVVGLASMLFVLAGCVFTDVCVEAEVVARMPQPEMQPASNVMCPQCDTMNTVANPDSGAPPVEPNCPQCGGPLDISPTTMLGTATGDDGEPKMMEITENHVCLEVGNPIFAFPEPGSKSMKDSDVFLWAERMTIEKVWRKYKFQATPDSIWSDGYTVTYANALNYYYLGYSTESNEAKNSCMVLRMYAEPGKLKDFPEGFYAVVVNQEIAHFETWEEFTSEHPWTKFDYLRIPTLFFPRSVSFDLVGIQRELNRYESLIALHAMCNAVTPWIVDENTVVSEITGRADRVITWRSLGPGSQAPHKEAAGSLDEGVYQQRQSLHDEFSNISQAVNVFRGKQEGGVTAGTAIGKLQAQAEQMFSKPVRNWAGGWKESIRKGIKAVQRSYSLPQLVKILGEDHLPQIKFFQAADLDTMVEFVATTSGLPRTREERKAEMTAMWDKGALDINDPNVKQKIFELFGETGMGATFNLDATRARLENAMMKQGQPAHVLPLIQDSAVHLPIHINEAKKLDFDLWPPGPKQLLIQHIMETQQAMQQAAIQAAEQQAAMQRLLAPPAPHPGGAAPPHPGGPPHAAPPGAKPGGPPPPPAGGPGA
jgi:hypothetical protein